MTITSCRSTVIGSVPICGVLATYLLTATPSVAQSDPSQDPQGGVIPVRVEHHSVGAPLVFGVPFPKGALEFPHQVRVVTPQGREVPSQITQVNTWEPASDSVKWIWVSFLAEEPDRYEIEYGPNVQRSSEPPESIVIVNSQDGGGFIEVTTGPLRFVVGKGEQSGFLDLVQLDHDRNGFEASDTVATGMRGRGSFVDILDSAGLDPSRAVVNRMVIEHGSGPLHAVIRVQGEYRYSRPDNNPVPFVTRIHAYAGRSYLRVFHTFVYTGNPTKHIASEGEHAIVATQGAKIREELPGDPAWMDAEDRVAAAGVALDVTLEGSRRFRTAHREADWWGEGPSRLVERELDGEREAYFLQSGPKPTRMPPLPVSSPDERLDGFYAHLVVDDERVVEAARADGWMEFTDGARGVTIGIRNFLEEYPKEIHFEASHNRATAYLWSPRVEPMTFARSSAEPSGGVVANFAQGIAKTSEVILDFHDGQLPGAQVEQTMRHFLSPPVPHATPAWYAQSGVYGRFATRSDRFLDHERWMDYRFEWMLFNQKWMPWFGMFDYGDFRENFDGEKWGVWGNNEPAVDFVLWLQFLRTGDPRLFLAAEAASRHSMDVDNTHWPADPEFYSDNNVALNWFRHLEKRPGSPLVGAGRRHAEQHWSQVMGAHVWVQGWLAKYYLTGYHRGLDVAIQTADFHLRRQWGEFELDARRLPLSVWNLVEVWDATKDLRYQREIEYRLEWMQRRQQRDQQTLVMDRYGFTYFYATHALARYWDITGDRTARRMLISHAQRTRDVPPINRLTSGAVRGGIGNWSMTSSIHGLVIGYELTHDPGMLEEIRQRIALMKAESLPQPIDDSWTQRRLYESLRKLQPGLPHPLDFTYLAPVLGRSRGMTANRTPHWHLTADFHDFGFVYVLPYALEVLGNVDTDATGRMVPRTSREE